MAEENKQVATRDENSLAVLIERPEYKNRFGDVMGQRAPQFLSSLLSLSMTSMKDVEPKSIIAAAMTAASLDLPINQNLGFAYIIAYKDNNQGGKKFAQFQMGYRGFIQLAQRSRQYRFINVCRVFEGELVKYDKLTGELIIDEAKKTSDTVVGYASFFKLTAGFEHALYMTREQVDKHAKQYSQAYLKGWKSMWKDDFDAMALKTVLKLNLSKWGPLSVQMERGIFEDQAVKHEIDAEPRYPDNTQPIPQAQIEGPGAPTAAPAPETPAAAAPTAATTTPAPTTPPAKKTPAKKKPSLTVLPDAKEPATPAATPAPTELPPGAKALMEKVNSAGHLTTDLLMIAIRNQWLDAPSGFDPENPDPADLEGMIVPEDKAALFMEPDNWALVLEQLAKMKEKPAAEPETPAASE